MKISFLKYIKDQETYKLPKGLGMDVFEIEHPEEVDHKIEELKEHHYTTIFIPSELASFSEKLVHQYQYDNAFHIVITPSKKVK